jgi:hypothetical protein
VQAEIGSNMKAGDEVKINGVPPNLHEDEELQTRSLFEKCVGKVFSVQAIEKIEGLDHPMIQLDVGEALGRHSWEHTIWIELRYVELMHPASRD